MQNVTIWSIDLADLVAPMLSQAASYQGLSSNTIVFNFFPASRWDGVLRDSLAAAGSPNAPQAWITGTSNIGSAVANDAAMVSVMW